MDVRGNVSGFEVLLVCNCGGFVLVDPVWVYVVHLNDEGWL